jgi:hypothetical protein
VARQAEAEVRILWEDHGDPFFFDAPQMNLAT